MQQAKAETHARAMAIIHNIPYLKSVEIKYSDHTGLWTIKYQQYRYDTIQKKDGII